MLQSSENKQELNNRLTNFYNRNKIKIYILVIILISIPILFSIIGIKNEKKNNLIAEQYVQATLNLSTKNNDKARLILEQIILSENEFYSTLALNTIIEKNLIVDSKKILKYFEYLENSVSKNDQKDIIILKKALYLIETSDVKKGKNLLENLIENNSNLKSIAKEILNK
tara:strand:+ start:889 stop:1398 length:510 start_codon:yes stop_codon:yes gene_type:complete